MTDRKSVSRNYGQTGLLDAIVAGLATLGKSPESVTVEDLAAVDEFHVGGREATQSLLERLELVESDVVLDIGCGIGGTARFATNTFGCRVVGIDVTEEYVHVGNRLCGYVGCASAVNLEIGDITDSDHADECFDKTVMLHVGMNIRDKDRLAAEAYRLLKPGGLFGVYDLMRVGDGEISFPVPWAEDQSTCALATPARYREALEGAGFEFVHERNRRDFALAFTARMHAKMLDRAGPPPLGLHLLMGTAAPVKYGNMVASIATNDIAPVEMLLRKPG